MKRKGIILKKYLGRVFERGGVLRDLLGAKTVLALDELNAPGISRADEAPFAPPYQIPVLLSLAPPLPPCWIGSAPCLPAPPQGRIPSSRFLRAKGSGVVGGIYKWSEARSWGGFFENRGLACYKRHCAS